MSEWSDFAALMGGEANDEVLTVNDRSDQTPTDRRHMTAAQIVRRPGAEFVTAAQRRRLDEARNRTSQSPSRQAQR